MSYFYKIFNAENKISIEKAKRIDAPSWSLNSDSIQDRVKSYDGWRYFASDEDFLKSTLAKEYQELVVIETLKASESFSEDPWLRPADGAEWQQPSGGVGAYRLGQTVVYNGKTFESVLDFNVWEPGVAGWREVASGGIQAWVQPTGATDSYKTGDKVTHKNQTWSSIIDNNVWEPGVYGWTSF